MTTGLYLLIGLGVVMAICGWIGLRWERGRLFMEDEEDYE
jgi:hypothetical protein